MKKLIAIGFLLSTINLSGCAGWGPQGCGQLRVPGQGVLTGLCSGCDDHCNNCDGYNPPFGNVRKTLACGSGCGEVYYGEWISNPPNTCNECDAVGRARGINARIPWLCNPLQFWGYQYRPNGTGYGNPLRGRAWGYGDSGAHWNASSCGGSNCGGCGDCGSSGGCSSTAPHSDGGQLRPIPADKVGGNAKQVSRPAKKVRQANNVRQVNYVAPKVSSSYGRTKTNNHR